MASLHAAGPGDRWSPGYNRLIVEPRLVPMLMWPTELPQEVPHLAPWDRLGNEKATLSKLSKFFFFSFKSKCTKHFLPSGPRGPCRGVPQHLGVAVGSRLTPNQALVPAGGE